MKGRLENDLRKEVAIEKILVQLPAYIQEWHLNLKASERTAATRCEYARKVKMFLSTIKEDPMEVEIKDITVDKVQRFLISIQTKVVDGDIVETSDSYRCTYWAMLRNLFTYLMERKLMAEDPMKTIKAPKNQDLDRIKHHRIHLTEEDFTNMVDSVDKDDNWEYDNCCQFAWQVRIRNKLILMLFMTTGMRKTALTEINVEDIDEDAKQLIVVDKRKVTHVYDLTPDVMDFIGKWKKARQSMLDELEKKSDAFFISVTGERLGRKGVDNMVARYSEMALGYKISPHKLRSGYVSILYNKTHDVEFVMKCVGHRQISTTERYIVTDGDEKKKAAQLLSGLFS